MRVTRRGFLTAGAVAAAAALAGAPPARAAAPGRRTLGRTGLSVSELGMGVMITNSPDIVRAALDAGVNYFDTARSYMGGRNEQILASGLGERRAQAVVATKCHLHGRAASIVQCCEDSLRALGTDWVDVLQLHGLASRDAVLHPENLEGLETLRKAGKIRFAGVSTHSGMASVIDAAVEAGVYDVVLTTLNFRIGQDVLDAAARAARAGVGVVAMKVMTGGYRDEAAPGLGPFQGALRWVLRQEGVATTIPSMVSLEQLQENLAATSHAGGIRDALGLELYAAAIAGRHCRVCGGCGGACPRGADVPSIMRGLMYEEGYRQPELARDTLARAAFPCAGCGACTVTCRSGIRVPERVAAALRIAGADAA